MPTWYDEIRSDLQAFIERQHLFFIATAPREGGRVNLSPKGMDSVRVLGPNEVVYLDQTGSGNETAAHIFDNGRVTMMWCSFERVPKIVRVYGVGEVVRPRHTEEWERFTALYGERAGVRQFIRLRVESVQTSCGYAVPMYAYEGERETLSKWSERKGEEGIASYWEDNNQESIDGLPTGIFKDPKGAP